MTTPKSEYGSAMAWQAWRGSSTTYLFVPLSKHPNTQGLSQATVAPPRGKKGAGGHATRFSLMQLRKRVVLLLRRKVQQQLTSCCTWGRGGEEVDGYRWGKRWWMGSCRHRRRRDGVTQYTHSRSLFSMLVIVFIGKGVWISFLDCCVCFGFCFCRFLFFPSFAFVALLPCFFNLPAFLAFQAMIPHVFIVNTRS